MRLLIVDDCARRFFPHLLLPHGIACILAIAERFYGRPPDVTFANAAEETSTVTMINEMAIGEDGWAQIAPFGDFPGVAMVPDGNGGFRKEKAIQRMDKAAVTQMANEYQKSSKGPSGFFKKRPLFEGHPDIPLGAAKYTNKSPVGIFLNIACRDNGFYGEPVLTEAGEQMIASKQYRALSGHWTAEFVGKEGDTNIYRPVKFLSAGLTNNPNLPVQLLNEAEDTQNTNKMKSKIISLLAALGVNIANEASEETVSDEVKKLGEKAKTAVTLANDKATLEGKVTTLTGELGTLRTEKATIETQLTTAKTSFANERTERISGLVSTALSDGKITAAEKTTWETRLGIEANFANEVTALNALKPKVKTESITLDLGTRQVTIANATERKEVVQSLVQEEMKNNGGDYTRAYGSVQRKHPVLFEAMKQPKSL